VARLSGMQDLLPCSDEQCGDAMMVADKLTKAALTERLDEVLGRARQGEAFVVERGRPVSADGVSTS
jgi:hypothetical protein